MSVTAPGADDRPWGRLAGAAVFLVFLWQTFVAIVDDLPDPAAWLGLVAIVMFVAAYVWGLTRVDHWARDEGLALGFAWVAFGLLATLAMVPAAEDLALIALVYVAAMAASMMPWRWALGTSVALFTLTEVLGHVVPGWSTQGVGLAIVLASFAVWGFRMAGIRHRQALAAQAEISDLALAGERDRIARDLHDILGHSLTVISVKSELAAQLVEADPLRARAELLDVQRLARDALADVRATTSGLLGRSLPAEIADARSALDAAGIEATLPTVTDDIPTAQRELFAWAVREAVTNVVRHSGARSCVVDLVPGRLVVTDDGGGTSGPTSGTGLAGLRHRAAQAGATVTTGSGPGGHGFRLTVEVRP